MEKLLNILALFAIITFASCGSDDDKVKEYQVTIASVKPLNVFIANETGSPSYFAKYDGVNAWRSFDYIDGFVYEDGYEYVLRIKQEKWHDGEVQDASMYRYTLIEEISKTKSNSSDIPEQSGNLLIASKKTGDDNFPYYVPNWQRADLDREQWVKFPPIEGFEYENGYEYVVRVNAKYNGVNAAQEYTYTFQKEWTKQKKDSENLLEQK